MERESAEMGRRVSGYVDRAEAEECGGVCREMVVEVGGFGWGAECFGE